MNERRIASQNDQRIFQMATYYETKGLLHTAPIEKVWSRFSEFKMLIKRGSYTIDQLESQTYLRFGIVQEDPNAKPLLEGTDPQSQLKKIFQSLMDLEDEQNKKKKKEE